ncbi:16713_t:CDS:2, partial [Gigaspora rosea]
NERIEKWKSVVKKMEKRKDSSNLEYITMGLKEANIMSCKHSEVEDIMKSTFEDAEALRIIESSDHSISNGIHSIRIKYGNYAETTNTIDSLIINFRESVTIQADLKYQRFYYHEEKNNNTNFIEKLKTITNFTDEQEFKKIYTNFKPSADDIKLKEDMMMMTLKDLILPSNDKLLQKCNAV